MVHKTYQLASIENLKSEAKSHSERLAARNVSWPVKRGFHHVKTKETSK
jgi:hypothetical protein